MKILFLIIFMASLLLSASSLALAAPRSSADYDLPYPGILPDSPFYVFKTLRDKISSFFISDPVQKAEFALGLADTRISAAQSMINQNKNADLAASTLSKGQNYFEEAINITGQAKNQGINTQELVKRLTLARTRHDEVIIEIGNKLNKIDKNKFKSVLNRSRTLREQLLKIK